MPASGRDALPSAPTKKGNLAAPLLFILVGLQGLEPWTR